MSVRLIRMAGGGVNVELPSGGASYINVSGGPAFAAFRLGGDGFVYRRQATADGAYTKREAWVTPTSLASMFEVEAVINSGSLTGGTSGSGVWQSLGSDRTWWNSSGSGQTRNANVQFTIRLAGGGVVDSRSLPIVSISA